MNISILIIIYHLQICIIHGKTYSLWHQSEEFVIAALIVFDFSFTNKIKLLLNIHAFYKFKSMLFLSIVQV